MRDSVARHPADPRHPLAAAWRGSRYVVGLACITPCTLSLKRKTGFVATIRKPGYRPIDVTVSSVDTERPGAAARSALTTGLVGYLVDRGNGALRELKPNPIDVTLTPESAPHP